MRTDRTVWMVLCCGLACVWVSGCLLQPSGIDEGLISRYQKSILERSPQRRAGEQGLDALRPLPEKLRPALKTVTDPLTGEAAVELSLEQAVRMALHSSPEIRVVGFDPAILREDVLQALAAFDVVVFAGFSQSWVDRDPSSSFLAGQTHTTGLEAGARGKTVYGTAAELKWENSRVSEDSVFASLSPRYESLMTLELAQPLLRGAGKDYNLAAVHLGEVGHKLGYAQFRQKVEEVVAQVVQTYWLLVQARGNLKIIQALLAQGEETLRKVRARQLLDAKPKIEVQQTIVAVEERRAALIRARKAVADVEDALARLLGDPRLNLMTDSRIRPTDEEPPAPPFTVDPIDQLVSALRHSPLLEQARLAIQAARINVGVARNETLPVLNLTVSTGIQGLAGGPSNAFEEMRKMDFIDYGLGLGFEYPWGNRAAEAKLRQRNLELHKAVATLQNLSDQVAVSVNEAIRQIQTSYAQIAAQERLLKALEANLEGLAASVEYGRGSYLLLLELILRQQDSLALSRRAKLQAMVDVKNAQSRLAQLTGTVLQQHHIKLMVEAEAARAAPPPTPPATRTPTTMPATRPRLPLRLPATAPG